MRFFTATLALALVACTMAQDQAAEPLRAVSTSTGLFATDFFKQIASEQKGNNLISSPLSAHVVLSMAAYGAGGNTAVQMRNSLHLPADDAVARQGFENLIDQLNNVENVTLEVANKMYLAKTLTLKPEYKQLTSGNFRSEVTTLDMRKSQESADIVNQWVDERTHHKIKKIVGKDDIDGLTRMLLLNAVYFKGKWAKAFKKEATQERSFHIDAKTEKKVPTMFVNDKFFYGELPDLKAKFIELPYENNDLKMVIIVPDEIDGLKNIEDNLEQFNYTRLAKSGYQQEVHLFLPKFKIESTIDLRAPLEKLGMKDMFTNAANFSGISNESLQVGKVLQKAFIEVNEEGSEAAAVTAGFFLEFVSAPASFVEPKILRADRPFYFGIYNIQKDYVVKMNVYTVTRSARALFTGRLIKP